MITVRPYSRRHPYTARHAKPLHGWIERLTAFLARVLAALLCPPKPRLPAVRAAVARSAGFSSAEAALRALLLRHDATDPLHGFVRWRRIWPRCAAVFDYPGEPVGCWHVRYASAQPALIRPYLTRRLVPSDLLWAES